VSFGTVRDVPEARDVEVRPVRKDAPHERDQARSERVEVAVRVVNGVREQRHAMGLGEEKGAKLGRGDG
jgi:hypothetical protein